MGGKGKTVVLTIFVAGLAAMALVGVASGARVQVGNIIIVADGGFSPSNLPKKAYAPIEIAGHARISTVDKSIPSPLQTAIFEFDKNGHLYDQGLSTCNPAKLQNTTVSEARSRCKGSIVGTGTAKAIVTEPGYPPLPAQSPLTFFNGPPLGHTATVVIHAYATLPTPTTYVLVTAIDKVNHGRFGYEVSTNIPSIAGGYGSLTRVSFDIGRKYTYKGHQLGFTSARCADGILQAHGDFTFADGTVIAGSVFKPCWVTTK